MKNKILILLIILFLSGCEIVQVKDDTHHNPNNSSSRIGLKKTIGF